MEEMLYEAQQAMLHYDIPKISQYLLEIFDALAQLQERLDASQQEQLQEILQHMNLALQNQDYLLLADLLEYGVQPLLNRAYQ